MNIVPEWLDRLEMVKATPKGWEARCPNHDDVSPSLSIDRGSKGWLLHCHRGCDTMAVCKSMGVGMRDLYYEQYRRSWGRSDWVDVDAAADSFFKENEPYRVCWKPHTFADVLWAAYPHNLEGFVEGAVEWHPYASDPFERTMKMWIVISDTWVSTWLGKSWSVKYRNGGMDWTEAKRWLNRKVWQTWIEQGCSTCPYEESPRPVLGL